MADNLKNYFILDGQILESIHYSESLVTDRVSIYEVIRVIQGIPVFIEDHINRLNETANLRNHKLWFDQEHLKNEICQLIEHNGEKFGNIKIVVSFDQEKGGQNHHRILSYIDHYYPSKDQYLNGVETVLYKAERPEPSAKVINLHELSSSRSAPNHDWPRDLVR